MQKAIDIAKYNTFSRDTYVGVILNNKMTDVQATWIINSPIASTTVFIYNFDFVEIHSGCAMARE